MKNVLLPLFLVFTLAYSTCAQISSGGVPLSFQKILVDSYDAFSSPFQTINLVSPDVTLLSEQDKENDSKGPLRVGVNLSSANSISTAGTWTQLIDGTKVWRLSFSAKDALALGVYFEEELVIPEGGSLFVYNKTKTHVLGAFTSETDGFKALEMIQGEELFFEYIASASVTTLPNLKISDVVYFYRGVEDHINQFKTAQNQVEKAGTCEVDVACSPEGNGWTDQINSVVYFSFPIGNFTYVCTAATVNNTAQDCKPYILSGWHCGEPTTQTNISQWVWYWNYQKANCASGNGNLSNPILPSTTMTGGVVRASSGNGTLNNPPGSNQVPGSDFYLVELASIPPANYNVYYAGWDRSNTQATSGVSIHHPDGSAKKISTFTNNLTSGTFNNGATNAHWRVSWSATPNGYGITEPGSSGAPIFNQNKRIVGQLSGGLSSCTATGSPDLYGKLYVSWDQCGSTASARLKPWLDPGNTGLISIDGQGACSSPLPPVANFVANPTTVSVGASSALTDLSTNNPTAWSWTITPATGWTYAGGTNAFSQNPQLVFSTQGYYTVQLVASNAQGSDTEIKTDYIHVTLATGPCTAISTTCDEFIQNVQLNTINNTSGCQNYADYNLVSTSLTRSNSYSLTITPQVVGQPIGNAYVGDEIAAWIDFNHDYQFDQITERVAFVVVTNGWSNDFNFTVPSNASLGSTWMRVRISYNGTDEGEGPINPCGTTEYGEVEDYRVEISDQPVGLNDLFLGAFQLYPNPTSETITLDLSSVHSSEKMRVEILDLTGKVVAEYSEINDLNPVFDVQKLAAGMYQLQLSVGNQSAIKRFVKQ